MLHRRVVLMPDLATASYCNSCTSVIKIILWENIVGNGFFFLCDCQHISILKKTKKEFLKRYCSRNL